jgi:hypothetical protein
MSATHMIRRGVLLLGVPLAAMAAVTALTPARAQDEEPTTSISGANSGQVWVAEGSRAATYLERFDLQVERGPWAIAARLEYDEEARVDKEHFAGIARRYAAYTGDAANLRAGTFYATFGRGLLLRAEEDETVRVDRDIDGVLGSVQWRAIQGQAFVGRPRHDVTHEREDLLSGAELSVRAMPGLRLGSGYVRLDADPADFASEQEGNKELEPGSPAEELLGGNVRWSHGPLEATFEGARRFVWGKRDLYSGWIGARGLDGEAYYGSLAYSIPGYSILVEGKDYLRFDAPYSTLPPANSGGVPINEGLNERGLGTSLTLSPITDVLCEAAASWAEAKDEEPERTSYEASVRQDWLGHGALELAGEWVEEIELESHAYRKYAGPRLEAIYYVGQESSLTLHAKVQDWVNHIRGDVPVEYTEVAVDLSFALDPYRAATFSVTTDTKEVPEYEYEHTWIALELAWSFGFNHDLKLKVGHERGGIVCSGGICHIEDPFSGARVEFTSHF